MSESILSTRRSTENTDTNLKENGNQLVNEHPVLTEKVVELAIPIVGEVIECRTNTGKYVGEVLTYDHGINFMILRDTSDGKTQMRFINMAHVNDVTLCVFNS